MGPDVRYPVRTNESAAPRRSTCVPLRWLRFTPSDVWLYRALDELSGAVLFLMVIFSPWAFGTTQTWSIRTMNIAGYALGGALAMKVGIRYLRGYKPPRWDTENARNPKTGGRSPTTEHPVNVEVRRRVIWLLVFLTLALLGWTFVSAWNARATFDNALLTFEYRDSIGWLPHSYDREATWLAFWMYLGLACTFWAAWDWILGKADGEERAGRARSASYAGHSAGVLATLWGAPTARPSGRPIPARLRSLLWLLAINGALLGIEAIIQRLAGSPELLFLVKPRIHQTAEGQFGPYAYRSNAAQYFNLLWPVGLGFWWTLNRGAGLNRRKHHLLLVAAAVMAACPIVSTSRGGAIITVLIGVVGTCALALTNFSVQRGPGPAPGRSAVGAVAVCVGGAVLLGFALGWPALRPRLDDLGDGLAGREQIYDAARTIADDDPMFGTGPGSFETISQLYPCTDLLWPAQLHNDWLETRITFGWLGSGLIGLALLCVLLRWFVPGGICGGRRFVMFIWLALAGCLLHARYDFPFQVHSILFTFLLLCAILFALSRRADG